MLASIDGVTYRYEGADAGPPVLQNVSFDVSEGEFVAILGPSGCGKSTLLYLLGGFLQPTMGAIRYRGEGVRAPSRERGIVFQDFALFDWRTAMQNVEFGLECLGLEANERRRRAGAMLELVGLSGAADKFPRQLSGGMKQRVAIARSLAAEPALLLMDEPFAALDALTRDTLQDELRRIWIATRKTIVFVTHSVEEAAYLSQRVIVMTARPGEIQAFVDIPLGEARERDTLLKDERFIDLRHRLGVMVRRSARASEAA